MPLAEFSLTDALLTTLSVFFFLLWIWIVITILSDLFRDHETSGWAKAAWTLFLIVIPFLTALAYLVIRGGGMRERAIREQAEVRQQMDEYIRSTAEGGSAADELLKLASLRDSGAISSDDFERMKSRLVA
ncbi:MAG: SHOCT domain-containing protein [Thermoleophilia bacterium]|nr:SHOCT domain-containing protein [Thermoleophilia bacterium]